MQAMPFKLWDGMDDRELNKSATLFRKIPLHKSNPTVHFNSLSRTHLSTRMVFPDPYPSPPDVPEEDDDTGSILSQEPQNPEIVEDMELRRSIPRTLTAWQRLLLETTQSDLERGAVSVIKCRLCPTERFKTWACFCRHCRDSEEHPAKIKCCERCGIYFGRQDSKKRHKDSATKVCCATTPAEAERRKSMAEKLLKDFQERVEDCVTTGEELGPKFAAIAGAELPSKSKKTSRKTDGK